ncbi:hypothetical protein EES42_08555 [Streptomyces sp. ADI95-17]|nr:hypothetical protein EES42_08555 [Streptomyces sp. ADI95-17]
MADTQGSASARFEIVPDADMPTGRDVLPVERRGEITWFVREGHMSLSLCAEINRALTQVTRTGRWKQDWDGPDGPPQPSR